MAAIQTTEQACVVLSLIEPTPGDKQIFADPEEFMISEGESVCWDVRVEDGDRVAIDFEETDCGDERRKGPFGPTPTVPNPGFLQRTGPGRMTSSQANCKGRWKYSVTWHRPGWKVHTLDPYIIIRG